MYTLLFGFVCFGFLELVLCMFVLEVRLYYCVVVVVVVLLDFGVKLTSRGVASMVR